MDPMIALAVFASYAAIDGLHAVYTNAVIERKKLTAASLSAAMYLLIALGVIIYTKNWLYVFPMAGGGWIGTYLSLWLLDKYGDSKKDL